MSRPHPNRREEILDAAEARFLQHGYLGTSVADLIADTGIAKGTFYHHFTSKQEVMEAVIDRHTERLAEAAWTVVSGEGPAIERFIRIFLDPSARPERSEELAGVMEESNVDPLQVHAARASVRSLLEPITHLYREGNERGELDVPDPAAAAAAVLVVIVHIVDRDAYGWVRESNAERLAELISVIERLMGAPHGALDPFRTAIVEGCAP